MIWTISRDADPVFCRTPDEMSRKAKINAAIAAPIALPRPNSATAIPANPRPWMGLDGKTPLSITSVMPTNPATAPESSIAVRIIRFGATPPALAANGLAPLARRSKPNRERLSST